VGFCVGFDEFEEGAGFLSRMKSAEEDNAENLKTDLKDRRQSNSKSKHTYLPSPILHVANCIV
jgi:hypothetical protein